MYKVVIFVILVLFNKHAIATDYKGHYRVSSPKHEIDIEKMLEKHEKEMRVNNGAIYDKYGSSKEDNNQNMSSTYKQTHNQSTDKNLYKQQQAAKEIYLQQEIEAWKKKYLEEQIRNKIKEELMKKQLLERAILKKQREEITHYISSTHEDKKSHNKKLEDTDFGLDKNESTLPVNRSRIITNDRYIVGILENSIDTQLSGRAIIVVEQDTFGAEGRKILLPKGSRIVCQYKSLEEAGQTRVPMECLRILRPDGVSISLTNAYVGDQMGRTGMVGQVDNRIIEKYGQALALSGITAGNNYASFLMSLSDKPKMVAGVPIIQNTNNTLSEVTKKVLEKTISLAPIVNIAKGSRVVLMPQTDIFIKTPHTNKKEE